MEVARGKFDETICVRSFRFRRGLKSPATSGGNRLKPVLLAGVFEGESWARRREAPGHGMLDSPQVKPPSGGALFSRSPGI